MKLAKLYIAAVLFFGGSVMADIKIIEAESAITLGTNYVVVEDINFPALAFSSNYITPQATSTIDPPLFDQIAIYSIGNLTSNMQYDLYIRLHIGTNTYGDDSIFISDGFQTNTFNMQNNIAGATALNGAAPTDDGFHWVKMNGNLDLSWRGPYDAGDGTNLVFALAPREDGLDVDAFAFVPANLQVTDEMLNPTNSGVALWPVGYLPDAPTTDSTPEIQALFADGAETVNTNNIILSLDGIVISNGILSSYSNTVTTISYTPASPLEAGATHTAKVVVASSPSGMLVTNEWTFLVQSHPLIYVDASEYNTVMAASPNGPVGEGEYLVTTPDSVMDGWWRFRTGFGVAPSVTNGPTGTITLSATNTLLESHDWQTADNVPRLKTSVSDLDEHTYSVYVYFWDANAQWCIRAGLEDTPGVDSLEYFDDASSNVVQVAVDTGGRTLHRAFLGYVTGTAIDVFVEDLPGIDSNDRTWYDGIGYQIYGGPTEPTINPDIQSYAVSEGIVTLSWTSETIGTYSIMHKTNVTDTVWTPVKTGIDGGDPTTMDSVPVSGASQEFFMIQGE